MTTVTSIKDIPKETHYVAIVEKTKSIYHEGDQRSRDYPGHGYPAYTETIKYLEYICFLNKVDLENWILHWSNDSKYIVIEAKPLSIKRRVEISIK